LYEQLGLAFIENSPSSFIPPTHSSHHSSPVTPQLPEAGLVNRRRFYSTLNSSDVPDDKLESFEVNLDGRSNLSTEFSYISDLEITDLRSHPSLNKVEVLKRLASIWNDMNILQNEIQTSNTTVQKTEVGAQLPHF
jgi:hypothetical protein